MKLDVLFVTGRSVTVMAEDGGLFLTKQTYSLRLNGQDAGSMCQVVHSIYGLQPDTTYNLQLLADGLAVAEAVFHTEEESFTLDVHRFGAVGDGTHDDTAAIQAAILCCPPKGRVLLKAGQYLVTPLFLKSHIRLEFAAGAQLLLQTDRSLFPVLPGMTQSTDEKTDLNLATWEGNPLDMYAAAITGVDVEDAVIYGPGVVDGQAQMGDWWHNAKVRRGAWRGRLLFLNRCKEITVQGVTFRNSPAWNLHPYFSQDLKFLNIGVQAPANSPNTDGFDPESCQRVLVAGAHFSLGDDCIALKAGKLYMGATYATPCQDIDISHCLMENGHGGVTIGSEMAGGVQHVRVHDCLMRKTDRGLRIKTRRGRGQNGVIDDIVFDRVHMEQVGTPFVVNALYYCDPDGHSPYVQSREKQPVDHRTPRLGAIAFRHVTAEGASCAGYFLGLPERPIERVEMSHVQVACGADAPPMLPAMADGVEECTRRGVVAIHVAELVMEEVTITGQDGDAVERMP